MVMFQVVCTKSGDFREAERKIRLNRKNIFLQDYFVK